MFETAPWEYGVQTFGTMWNGLQDNELEAEINLWGEQGWEVIGLRRLEKANRVQAIAKRPLPREVRQLWSMP